MPTEAKPTVLLVEDEHLLRLVMGEELRDAGFAVIEAENGAAAVEVVKSGAAIDLLLTDIRMPGAISGWDVAEQARNLRPGLAVIYATGFSEDAPRIVPGGRFFKKPYRASAIIDAARELGVPPAA
jgi:CheY-like chemotaxis protein